jgi:hypothetical protein
LDPLQASHPRPVASRRNIEERGLQARPAVRAGIEGRISVLFRGRGMKRSNSGTAGGEVRKPAHRAQLRIKFGFETWEQDCMMLESTCPMNALMHAMPTTSRR